MAKHSKFTKILVALFFLNIFDALATFHWVSLGIAEEGNPLMAEWLTLGYNTFVFVKVSMVSLALFLLYRFRENRFARILIWPVIALYSSVFLIHCAIAFKQLQGLLVF